MRVVLEYRDPQIQSHSSTGKEERAADVTLKATRDLLLECSALDSHARALYPHKLLTIGDLTHLLRWNYGADLELENVCFGGRQGQWKERKDGAPRWGEARIGVSMPLQKETQKRHQHVNHTGKQMLTRQTPLLHNQMNQCKDSNTYIYICVYELEAIFPWL